MQEYYFTIKQYQAVWWCGLEQFPHFWCGLGPAEVRGEVSAGIMGVLHPWNCQ